MEKLFMLAVWQGSKAQPTYIQPKEEEKNETKATNKDKKATKEKRKQIAYRFLLFAFRPPAQPFFFSFLSHTFAAGFNMHIFVCIHIDIMVSVPFIPFLSAFVWSHFVRKTHLSPRKTFKLAKQKERQRKRDSTLSNRDIESGGICWCGKFYWRNHYYYHAIYQIEETHKRYDSVHLYFET